MECFPICLCHLFIYVFLSQSLTLLHELKGSGAISAHCNLHLPGSRDSPASASQLARIIGTHHHGLLIVIFLVETRFYHVSQAGCELLTSNDQPQPPNMLELQIWATVPSSHLRFLWAVVCSSPWKGLSLPLLAIFLSILFFLWQLWMGANSWLGSWLAYCWGIGILVIFAH